MVVSPAALAAIGRAGFNWPTPCSSGALASGGLKPALRTVLSATPGAISADPLWCKVERLAC